MLQDVEPWLGVWNCTSNFTFLVIRLLKRKNWLKFSNIQLLASSVYFIKWLTIIKNLASRDYTYVICDFAFDRNRSLHVILGQLKSGNAYIAFSVKIYRNLHLEYGIMFYISNTLLYTVILYNDSEH